MTARVWDTASGQETFHFSLADVFQRSHNRDNRQMPSDPDGTKLVVTSGAMLRKSRNVGPAHGDLVDVVEEHPDPIGKSGLLISARMGRAWPQAKGMVWRAFLI